jgi:hypothetical protein
MILKEANKVPVLAIAVLATGMYVGWGCPASRVETVAAEDRPESLAKGQSMEGIPLDVQLRNAVSTRRDREAAMCRFSKLGDRRLYQTLRIGRRTAWSICKIWP